MKPQVTSATALRMETKEDSDEATTVKKLRREKSGRPFVRKRSKSNRECRKKKRNLPRNCDHKP